LYRYEIIILAGYKISQKHHSSTNIHITVDYGDHSTFFIVSRFTRIVFANAFWRNHQDVNALIYEIDLAIRATFCRREVHSAVTSSYVFRMRSGTSSAWRHNHSVLVNHQQRNDWHFRKAWRWCTLMFKMSVGLSPDDEEDSMLPLVKSTRSI